MTVVSKLGQTFVLTYLVKNCLQWELMKTMSGFVFVFFPSLSRGFLLKKKNPTHYMEAYVVCSHF